MKWFFAFLLFPLLSFGQDPGLSQFYASQLYVNPAYAGLDKGYRIYAHYKNQWPRVYSKFETFNGAFDIQNYAGGGLGIILLQDVAGEGYLKTTNAEAIYSWGTALGPYTMWQVGFKGGMISKRIDWSKLQFSDQIDPVNGFVYQSTAQPPDSPIIYNLDFSCGTLVRFTNIFRTKSRHLFGAAFSHLTQPDVSLLGQEKQLPIKYSYHYTGEWLLGNKMKLGSNLLFETQDMFKTFMASFTTTKKPLLLGISFRERTLTELDKADAIIVHLGYKDFFGDANWSYQFVYSFDKTISGLVISTAGAHEVSLILENSRDPKMRAKKFKRKKPIKCVEWENEGVPRF